MKVEYKKRESVINDSFIEQVIYEDSSFNWVQLCVILCGFNTLSLFANNSDETKLFFGVKVAMWHVILLLSVLLSLPFSYRIINRKRPVLVLNKLGIRFRGEEFFEWEDVSELFLINKEDDSGDIYKVNLWVRYKGELHKQRISGLKVSVEEIDRMLYNWWYKT